MSGTAMLTGCEEGTGMSDNIFEALALYLKGYIDLDSLEYRVITLAWDDEFEDQDLVDRIAIELIYIKDGLSDESIFRTRMAEIASQVPVSATP